MAKYNTYTAEQINEARLAYNGGMSITDISKVMDIPHATVNNWKKCDWKVGEAWNAEYQVTAESIVNAFLNKFMALQEKYNKLEDRFKAQAGIVANLSKENLELKEKQSRSDAAKRLQALVIGGD